jgi:hypothetical protein
MKTKTYLIFSAAAIFSMTSCTNSTNNTEDKNNGAAADVQSLLDEKHTPREFKHVIPLDAMKAMVSTYETERVALINTNPQLRRTNGENFVDSKSGWVSLDDLSSFIDEIKAAAKNKGLETKDLGVRMYYTVYPQQQAGESSYFKSLENEYRSRQTFLMLPTYHDSKTNANCDILSTNADNRSQEFFIGNAGTGKSSNMGARSSEGDTGAPGAAASGTAAQSYIGLNHMALCPPACPN